MKRNLLIVNAVCFLLFTKITSGQTLPYFDNFDTTNLWTATITGGSNWQLGTPSFGATNSAHSAPNAWDIDLTSGYVDNASCTLTSPVFSFAGTFNPTLSFWQNRNCEASWDGTRLEYTLNGTTWQILGVVGDPNATNWYTDAQLNSSSLPAWEGSSVGWVKSTYKLGCLFGSAGGPVQFRFIFTSDGSVTTDGFSIDDFSITLPSAQDIGVSSIIQPGAVAPAATAGTVKVVVANFGSQAVSGFNVNYSVNGGVPVSQAYPGTLLPCDIDTVTFTTTFSVPAGTFGICAYTSFAGDANHSNDTICKNSQGIPLLALPYTDDFETPPALWYDSSAIGTNWQLGTPAFGATSSAHSGTQAWDINLTTSYGNNARSLLTSPLLDFMGQSNAKLSFWMNRNIDPNGDGVYLEYSVNGGTTFQRLGIVGDPNAYGNWYNKVNLNFTSLPGWDSNSGGWVKYTYILGPPFNNAGPNVQFRFIFASNFFTTTDGVSIDDVAIVPATPVDLGVISINQPTSSSGSGLSTIVDVTIRNYGTTTVTNTDVAYVVNGTVIATEPWTGSLAPSATANFTFTTPFIVPVGLYDICSYTSLVTDGDHSNDTICTSKHGIPLFTLPYIDNFDTGAVVWTDSSGNPGTHWELGTPNFGQTTGAFSAPNSWDVNLNSGYGSNASSYLTSPLFDFTGIFNAKLSFWQNRKTESSWDGIRVEYSTNGGGTWQVLGVQFDPLGTYWYNKASIFSSSLPAWDGTSIDSVTGAVGWIKSTYKLVPLNNAGANCMLRFVFTSDGIIEQDGFSIDDLKIVPPSPQDASAFSILQPGAYSPAGVLDSVKVIISNEGLNPISNFAVSYSINSVLTGTATYTGTLQPSIHDTITLPPFTVPTGLYDICAFTSLTGDGDLTNDTTCKSSFGVPLISLPYADNFETGPVIWSDSSSGFGTSWQLGTPNYGSTNSTHSGTQAWDINLAAPYSDNAHAVLTSPLFDFTGQLNAKLSFWMNRNIDTGGDGVYMEYSVNGSTTWQRLGVPGDPNALGNWYNIANLNFTNLPAWTGNSGGWVKYTYILGPPFNNAGPNVQFRFVFTSNFFTTSAGVSIDDFSIVPASPVDLGMISINQPAGFVPTGSTATVNVTFRNFGTTTITNTDVAYVLNGTLIATEPWTGSLAPSATANFTFTAQFTVPSGLNDLCSYTSLVADGDHTNDTLCKSVVGYNAHDVGVTAILKPVHYGILGTNDSVKVVIYNYGIDTTSNFQVRYRINSGSVVTETFTGTIQPGASATFTFNTTFVIPPDAYTICSWTSAFNDIILNNDTLCKSPHGLHTIFHEDFEVVDSMTTSGIAPWFQDANYHTNGTHCMRDTVSVNGTAYLTSIAFSTVGEDAVVLYFDQICKISFADHGYIEVSADNGTTWTTLTGSSYLGASVFFPGFNYFSSFSYDSSWHAANDLAIPQISWWRREAFDLTSVVANSPQVKIRFNLSDGNGNGSSGNYGWLVDRVEVAASTLIPANVPSIDNHPGSLTIYPNPSSGIFYLKKDGWMKNNSSVIVRDILGNEILKVSSFKSEFAPLDLSSQPNGIYLVSVISNSKTVNQRVVICK